MSIRAGGLNRRIVIRRLGEAQDDIGQPVPAWVDVVSVWANVQHKSGVQTIRADKDTAIVQASIRIRRRDGIDESMRVDLGAVVYEIQAVIPDEVHREYMDLVCQMVKVAAGA